VYVITGATGRLGRLVIENLLTAVAAREVAAVVRDPARAEDLGRRGVNVRVATYDDPGALEDVFERDDKVLLISGSEVGRRIPQHRAVVDAARAAHVAHLVYTSALGGPQADFPLADEHQATEQAIFDSGLVYTMLRNGWYHENYTGQIPQMLATGRIVHNAGLGRVGSAARADYAQAAAAVLTGTGHENKAYELNGDTAWSFPELAALVSERSGHPVAAVDLPAEEHVKVMIDAGMAPELAEVMAGVDEAIKRGSLEGRGEDLSWLIGRPTTSMETAIGTALAQM
jgi:NAD(P)H dehydrogenase (quinone)